MLLFLRDPEESLSMVKILPITIFKKWLFANNFKIETKNGKVLFALCKYCSEVEYSDFMRESSAIKPFFYDKVLHTFIEVHMPVM